MSERVAIPTESAKCSWALGGAAYPSTDPGAGKRDVGWQPKDNPVPGPGEVIPATGHNFLWRLGMQMIAWTRDFIVREWHDVAEAIAATVVPQIFRVTLDGSNMDNRFAPKWDVTGTATGGGSVKQPCTDGGQIYYFAGTGNVSIVAVDPADGSELWEEVTSAEVVSLTCDGAAVYYNSDATQPGLRKLTRDGGNDGNGGTEFGCDALRANGVYCVGVNPSSSSGRVVFWTVATPTETGTQTPSGFLEGVAIDATHCYVGGTRNVSDVWAYNLSDRSQAWAVTLDANAPTVRSISADGDFVYVTTDSFATAAGPNRNLFCLSRYDGRLLWSMDVAAQNLFYSAVDRRYLYVAATAGALYQIRLSSPGPAIVHEDGDWNWIVCDGVTLIGPDDAVATKLKRHWTGGPPKTFVRVSGNDPNRRPFYTLAVPIDR